MGRGVAVYSVCTERQANYFCAGSVWTLEPSVGVGVGGKWTVCAPLGASVPVSVPECAALGAGAVLCLWRE